jgi:hypothetical protein
MKKLKSKDIKFHTYKSKKGTLKLSLNICSLQRMWITSEKELKIKDTQLPIYEILRSKALVKLFMFCIELKPKTNNKDIYEIRSLFHCKIKFELSHLKREIPQCVNCQRYGIYEKFLLP